MGYQHFVETGPNRKHQGFSWVMNRLAIRVRRLSKSCGSGRVGSGGVRNPTGLGGLVRSGRKRFYSHGSVADQRPAKRTATCEHPW